MKKFFPFMLLLVVVSSFFLYPPLGDDVLAGMVSIRSSPSPGQQIDHSSVQVTLDAVEPSSAGTIVRYHLDTLLPENMMSIGMGPRIQLPNGSRLVGVGPAMQSRGQLNSADFPVLPQGISQISVEFGPYWVSNGKAATFAISLPAKASDLAPSRKIALGQNVSLGAAEYRTFLVLGPSSFVIAFEPANEVAKSSTIRSLAAKVSLGDDLGNSYLLADVGTTFSAQNELASQEFGFEGKLSSEARELRFQTSATGEILRGPWVFDVAIQR